jgi:hypothetical protein
VKNVRAVGVAWANRAVRGAIGTIRKIIGTKNHHSPSFTMCKARTIKTRNFDMSRIATIDPVHAPAGVQATLAAVKAKIGTVPNLFPPSPNHPPC